MIWYHIIGFCQEYRNFMETIQPKILLCTYIKMLRISCKHKIFQYSSEVNFILKLFIYGSMTCGVGIQSYGYG